MKKYYIGFDTSNYTTSMAACDEDGRVVANVKIPLPVKEGERGLRQSDAVFHHTKNLYEIYERFGDVTADGTVAAVAASDRPRDMEESYMPCFLTGKAAAKGYASALRVPLCHFSHQDGHIMAALYSAANPEDGRTPADTEALMSTPFAAFHVSGGTTELLLAEPAEKGFKVTKIGGTEDLNAGQAIDRIGVLMGLRFPCGPEMERLAKGSELPLKKPHPSVSGLSCHLSGLENLASALYRETESREAVSAFVFEYVAVTLGKLTENLREKYKDIPVIYAGGVMSNSIIKSRLACREGVYFAAPQFSADNAAGIALLCRRENMK